jgi:hypothetical protein
MIMQKATALLCINLVVVELVLCVVAGRVDGSRTMGVEHGGENEPPLCLAVRQDHQHLYESSERWLL